MSPPATAARPQPATATANQPRRVRVRVRVRPPCECDRNLDPDSNSNPHKRYVELIKLVTYIFIALKIRPSRQLALHFGDRVHRRRRRKPFSRGGVPHRARQEHKAQHPVHVTLRAGRRLPSLREQVIFFEMRSALRRTARSWFRVVHFSVQANHVHLLVESDDKLSLSRGVMGVAIRMARAVNRVLERHGNVWSERYHSRALKTPRETRNGIVYVLVK